MLSFSKRRVTRPTTVEVSYDRTIRHTHLRQQAYQLPLAFHHHALLGRAATHTDCRCGRAQDEGKAKGVCSTCVHAGVVLRIRVQTKLYSLVPTLLFEYYYYCLCAVAGACTEPGTTRWPSDNFHQANQALRSRQLRCSCQSCNRPHCCIVERAHYYSVLLYCCSRKRSSGER